MLGSKYRIILVEKIKNGFSPPPIQSEFHSKIMFSLILWKTLGKPLKPGYHPDFLKAQRHFPLLLASTHPFWLMEEQWRERNTQQTGGKKLSEPKLLLLPSGRLKGWYQQFEQLEPVLEPQTEKNERFWFLHKSPRYTRHRWHAICAQSISFPEADTGFLHPEKERDRGL